MEYDCFQVNFPINNIINLLHVPILSFLYIGPLKSGSTTVISPYIHEFDYE